MPVTTTKKFAHLFSSNALKDFVESPEGQSAHNLTVVAHGMSFIVVYDIEVSEPEPTPAESESESESESETPSEPSEQEQESADSDTDSKK